jgi:solute carrier family 35 protein E3
MIETMLVMGLNFFSSVFIIWANKMSFNTGFEFPTILTIVHFLSTFFGLYLCVRHRLFDLKYLPVLQVLPISLAFCGFVVFNNLSLQTNTIGTYQLLKVMTTPVIVGIQFFWYNVQIPSSQLLSLVPVCVGVILATVSSVDTNWRGSLYGLLGIVSTSIYQIWVKTEQNRLGCSSEQLLIYQAPLSGLLLVLIAPFFEDLSKFSAQTFSLECIFWTTCSSLLAFLVNLSIFLVISRTSPVSYNVLGHAKLCLILVSGYTLFGESYSAKNLIGVGLAVLGIVWYTHLKLLSSDSVESKSALKEEATTDCLE